MMTPISTKPRVTKLDVARGSITRYFIKHVSRHQILEIDAGQYNFYKNNPYYIAIKLPWVVAGNLFSSTKNGQPVLSIEEQNKKIVDFYDKRMSGLSRKLQNLLEYASPVVNTPVVQTSPSPISTVPIQSQPTSSVTPELVWSEIAYDTIPNRGSDVNLNTTTPDGTLNSGWTAYDYGATATNYLAKTYGVIQGNVANPPVIYPNVNFNHDKIRIYCNVTRLSTDQTSSGTRIQLFSSQSDSINLRAVLSRTSPAGSFFSVDGIDASGTVTTLISGGGISLATSTTYTIILEVDGNTVNAYYASGASVAIENATLLGTATLPSYITDLDRSTRTFAIQSVGGSIARASSYTIGNISIWNKI